MPKRAKNLLKPVVEREKMMDKKELTRRTITPVVDLAYRLLK